MKNCFLYGLLCRYRNHDLLISSVKIRWIKPQRSAPNPAVCIFSFSSSGVPEPLLCQVLLIHHLDWTDGMHVKPGKGGRGGYVSGARGLGYKPTEGAGICNGDRVGPQVSQPDFLDIVEFTCWPRLTTKLLRTFDTLIYRGKALHWYRKE